MSILMASQSGLIQPMECLWGIFKDNFCYYNAAHSATSFSLGEAVGALALIFAVYQLTQASWRIVFSIRPSWQKNLLFLLSGLGLVFILIASLIPQLPISFLVGVLKYPSFFETLGFLSFIGAASSYFYFGITKRKIFNIQTAEKFYFALVSEMARGKKENFEAIVNIIGSNLGDILKTVKYRTRRDPNNSYKLNKRQKAAEYASAIFDVIIGNDDMANYITTSRLDFMGFLFEVIKVNRVSRFYFEVGIGKVFKCLFQNKESHLYKQLERSGLSLSSNLYIQIFEDQVIMDLLEPFWNSKLNDEGLAVFLKALEHTTKAYLSKKRSFKDVRPISQGFDVLNSFMDSLWYQKINEDSVEQMKNNLQSIEFFLGHGFRWAYLHAVEKDTVSDMDMNATQIDDFVKSLGKIYAISLTNYIKALAGLVDKVNDETLCLYAMTCTEHLIGLQAQRGDAFEGIRNEFLESVWKEIYKNGDGYFPVVLRVYISIIAMDFPRSNIYNEQRIRVGEFLRDVIKTKILGGAEMANGDLMEAKLLPDNVKFDRVSGSFSYAINQGKTIQLLA